MRAVRRTGRLLARMARAESGATAIEYAMIAVGISIVIVTTVNVTGVSLRTNYFEKVQQATAN
ncbi:Flp family type IVb pilin [Methylopila sp. M107]|uniref:Flp family type IVb pilin n=1 Tax=Methylopila sp. M107 TaxID=1101190 RepID=UPI00058E5282|nr:Flp family type IVb pilin [Methylopila sp. M107]